MKSYFFVNVYSLSCVKSKLKNLLISIKEFSLESDPWIIFSQVISLLPKSINTTEYLFDTSELNVELITDFSGVCLNGTFPLNFYFNTENSISVWLDGSKNISAWITNEDYINANVICTIQYTKTTDEPNSFTNLMLKESFIKLDSTCTDEELQQAISDMVEEINAEEVTPEVIDESETEAAEGGQE